MSESCRCLAPVPREVPASVPMGVSRVCAVCERPIHPSHVIVREMSMPPIPPLTDQDPYAVVATDKVMVVPEPLLGGLKQENARLRSRVAYLEGELRRVRNTQSQVRLVSAQLQRLLREWAE